MLNILYLISFFSAAQANFVLEDGTERNSTTISTTHVDERYTLETVQGGSTPQLKVTSKVLKSGKFIPGKQITFEEQCILAAAAPSCVTIPTQDYVPSDNRISSLYANGPLHISREGGVRMDSFTLSARGPVTFEEDRIQINGFLKTPELTFLSRHPHQGINCFVLRPYKFSFESKTGLNLESGSIFVSADIDFANQTFGMDWQCAECIEIYSDRIEE